MRWTIERPGIMIALVGARHPEQVIANAMLTDVKLSSEEIAFINDQLPFPYRKGRFA